MTKYRDNTFDVSLSSGDEENSGIINVDALTSALLEDTFENQNASTSTVLTPARLNTTKKMAHTIEEIGFTNPEAAGSKKFDAIRHSLNS